MPKPAARSEVTHLSTKGQLTIPKEIRERHGWTAGMELIVEDLGNSVVLRRARARYQPQPISQFSTSR